TCALPIYVDDVGAALRLDGGRDARLQIVGVDELELDVGAQRLRRLAGLLLQLDVAGRDEVDPAHDVQPGPLREGGGPMSGQDSGDTGQLQERSALHRPPPSRSALVSLRRSS